MNFKHALLLASIISVAMGQSAAADQVKGPCQAMAEYLRAFAKRNTDKTRDTGHFEFLNAAAHIADDKSDANAAVSAVAVRHFNTLRAALLSIPGVAMSDVAPYDDERYPTDVRDLRGYNGDVLFSQAQGSADCDYPAMVQFADGRALPLQVTMSGAVCFTSALLAIRVGRQAYVATRTVDAGPSKLQYRISLHHPNGPIGENAGFCRVVVEYNPELTIKRWYTAVRADQQTIQRLRRILDPIIKQRDQPSAALMPLNPPPSGSSLFDDFLRSDEEHRDEALSRLDPDVALNDMPFAEDLDRYSDASHMLHYAVEIAHHCFILGFGQPELGWRVWPDNAFALWEWNGQKLVPFASGYVEKLATNPVISAE